MEAHLRQSIRLMLWVVIVMAIAAIPLLYGMFTMPSVGAKATAAFNLAGIGYAWSTRLGFIKQLRGLTNGK